MDAFTLARMLVSEGAAASRLYTPDPELRAKLIPTRLAVKVNSC